MPRNSPFRAAAPSRSTESAGTCRLVTAQNWRTAASTYIAAEAPQPLHHPHDLGIQAQDRVGAEVALAGQPHADAPGTALLECAKDLPGRVHEVGGQAESAGEDVRAPARQGGEYRGAGARQRGTG